jgi:pimeloyl-ACP methyl ester carboxylesterase
MEHPQPYAHDILPPGLRSRIVAGINGLDMHVIEAGHETPGRPCVLLLHGFPELAWSWRRVMPVLAAAGYHVLAPDQRGYGRTRAPGAPWQVPYDTDLTPFGMQQLACDALALVHAFGYRRVRAVVGHDFGSSVAAWSALIRPDVFTSVVLMSAPFPGTPVLPFGNAHDPAAADAPVAQAAQVRETLEQLARLPRPRKHYQWYYATREANAHMQHAPQGLHAFLRGYYHVKSADWAPNTPHPLRAWNADELAQLPTYYIMDAGRDMAATVVPEMPSAAAIAACRWLPDDELAVYVGEYARTGFQGGLNWYRSRIEGQAAGDMRVFAGRTIDVPAIFIAGRSDWGTYQKPGDVEAMQSKACTRFEGLHLIEGAGHWVQQEQDGAVSELLRSFLARQA